MKKTNVLHIIETLGLAGAEKIVAGTINGLPRHNHHLIYFRSPDTLLTGIPSNCKVRKLNVTNILGFIKAIFIIRRYIRRNNIRIVHSHLCIPTVVARIACPRDVQLFTTIHNLPSKSYFKASKVLKWLEKLTYRARHHIIAICHEVYKDYQRCIGIRGKATILYNYIEDGFFSKQFRKPDYGPHLKLVAVGTLKYQKNYAYLLEAFKKLPRNISLDIYGIGPLQEEMQQQIDQHNLNIRLMGLNNSMEKVLTEYDAMVMSSHYEGQPLAVLEAMAIGLPVILSDISVLREVTDNNAVFFNLADSTDLTRKLLALSNKEIDLTGFAHNNFERAKKIAGKQNYMASLEEIYNKVLVPQDVRSFAPSVTSFQPLVPDS
jgi:glycosyltransferase involved in cell wall biosynthesis